MFQNQELLEKNISLQESTSEVSRFCGYIDEICELVDRVPYFMGIPCGRDLYLTGAPSASKGGAGILVSLLDCIQEPVSSSKSVNM